jgi:hypothetical protein
MKNRVVAIVVIACLLGFFLNLPGKGCRVHRSAGCSYHVSV